MISIKNLDKKFNRGKQNEIHVLNDITLDLPESGMVAIFGRSGCGKTTLLNVIGGLDRSQSGSVEIEGERMGVSSDTLRNRSVGYIFQNYCLSKKETCFENVANALRLLGVSDRAFIEEQVNAALSAVGMEHFAARLPDTLSGGQQQRVAIARAIVKNPPVILADEPTGNLDEANTLHVMRLLKEISRERLVLLVTHEENLVDAFCDRVIELSDGRVVGDRENAGSSRYAVRDKNAVYLGELQKTTLLPGESGVSLDLYGQAPEGVKIRLVNADGKLYLKVDSEGVRILDETSEIKLLDGAFVGRDDEKTEEAEDRDDSPDLSAIKPVEGEGKCGRLFGFGKSWVDGIRFNLGIKKRGRKLLRRSLILFAAVVVFMTASLGVFIRNLIDVDGKFHHHIVYAYAGDPEAAAVLNGMGEEQGVVYRQQIYSYPPADHKYSFLIGTFETFSGGRGYFTESSTVLSSNGVALSRAAAEGKRLLAGKNTNLSDDEILISEAYAKALIASTSISSITEYEDLLGIRETEKALRVAGVVAGNERELYLPAELFLDDGWSTGTPIRTPALLGMPSDIAPQDGFVAVLLGSYDPTRDAEYPKTGDALKIYGEEMTVDRVICDFTETYEHWCEARGYTLPDLSEPTFALYSEYIAHYSDYLAEKTSFFGAPDPVVYGWIQSRNPDSVLLAVGTDTQTGENSYIAPEPLSALWYLSLWQQANPGEETPTVRTVSDWAAAQGDESMSELYREWVRGIRFANEDGFYNQNVFYSRANSILVNDRDAEKIVTRCGETTVLGKTNKYYEYYLGYLGPATQYYPSSGNDEAVVTTTYARSAFMMLWTNDVAKTEAYLKEKLGVRYAELAADPTSFLFEEEDAGIVTPAELRQEEMIEQKAEIVSNAIELAVFLAVMSVCMYMIMRASTMGRIREIGIYRAIGVSKANLVFRFFVEALSLSSLTVFVGYVFSSVLITAWLVKVPFIGTYFYYPAWMALATLVLLLGVSSFCGTLPVLRLLRKTPSEILSKYDI